MGKRMWSWVLARCLLAACGSQVRNTVTGQQERSVMDPQAEIALGRREHAAVLKDTPGYANDRVQAYVNALGQRLARLSHRSDLEWHFTVLDSPEINAFALPGGYAYLRLVHNPLDSVNFARVINTPPRGIGSKTQQDLEQWAFVNSMSPSEAVVRLATDLEVQHPFNGRSHNTLANFGSMLNAWLMVRDSASVGELLDLILEQTEYRDYIEDSAKDPDEARDRWANVMELRGVALMSSELTLCEFLEQVALVSETDDLEDDPKAVTLLTLHAAKGQQASAPASRSTMNAAILPRSTRRPRPSYAAKSPPRWWAPTTCAATCCPAWAPRISRSC